MGGSLLEGGGLRKHEGHTSIQNLRTFLCWLTSTISQLGGTERVRKVWMQRVYLRKGCCSPGLWFKFSKKLLDGRP